MAEPAPTERQLPLGREIFLDHIAHYIGGADDAARGLKRAGFQPAPASIQRNPDGSLTGTGNVTAMLRRGYLEMLFKTADTPLSAEFDAARGRYPGLHLIAFSAADARAERRRLQQDGFRVRDIAEMSRPVPTETGEAVASFTVARIAPEDMPEGRIQILTHHTEDAVWQKRWLDHPNGAQALMDVIIAVSDVDEAAKRFARFTGRGAAPTAWGRAIALDRGTVQVMRSDAFAGFAGLAPPALPFIGLAAIEIESLGKAEAALRAGRIELTRRGHTLVARFPEELGTGAWIFAESTGDLPWRRQS